VNEIGEIPRGNLVVRSVCDQGSLVEDALPDREPVQISENGSGMLPPSCTHDCSSQTVLHALKSVNVGLAGARQYRVAVVQA